MLTELDTGYFDPEQSAIVLRTGGLVKLTRLECRLLAWLVERPGRASSHREILSAVWGYDIRARTRTLYTTVTRLRSKIEREPSCPRHLIAVAGLGYRLDLFASGITPRRSEQGFGRDELLQALDRAHERHRLLLLHGPGGIGKSWLARAFAGRRPGVVVVDCVLAAHDAFGPPSPPGMGRVRDALGLRDAPGDAETVVAAALRARGETTLVLDDLDPAPSVFVRTIDHLLHVVPSLRIVATARLPLPIPGCHVVEVPPLTHEAAYALFRDRAARHLGAPSQAAEALDAAEAEVHRIVAGLDGFPLAIELAAGRLRTMGVTSIAAQMDSPLPLLSATSLPPGSRAASRAVGPGGLADFARSRHESMARALEDSYESLSVSERACFDALGCFVRGFDIASLRALIGDELGFVPDLVRSLVERSLVHLQAVPGAPSELRYGLYSLLGELARMRLGARRDTLALRHASYFARRFDWMSPVALRRDPIRRALALAERDDIARALAWSLAHERHDLAVGCLVGLWTLATLEDQEHWLVPLAEPLLARDLDPAQRATVLAVVTIGHCAAGSSGARELSDRAIAVVEALRLATSNRDPRATDPILAALFVVRARVRSYFGEHAGAVSDATDALHIGRRLGLDIERMLRLLCGCLVNAGDLRSALLRLGEAEHLARMSRDDFATSAFLGPAVDALCFGGRHDDALAFCERALAAARRHQQLGAELIAHLARGKTLIQLGRMAEAQAELEIGRTHAPVRLPRAANAFAVELARLYRASGDLAASMHLYEEALARATDPTIEAMARTGLARLALLRGDRPLARAHADAALAVRSPPFLVRLGALSAAAQVALADGRPEDARALLDEAGPALDGNGPSPLLAGLLALRARLRMGTDRASAERDLSLAERFLTAAPERETVAAVREARLALTQAASGGEGADAPPAGAGSRASSSAPRAPPRSKGGSSRRSGPGPRRPRPGPRDAARRSFGGGRRAR